jgi:hypothetical protein
MQLQEVRLQTHDDAFDLGVRGIDHQGHHPGLASRRLSQPRGQLGRDIARALAEEDEAQEGRPPGQGRVDRARRRQSTDLGLNHDAHVTAKPGRRKPKIARNSTGAWPVVRPARETQRS